MLILGLTGSIGMGKTEAAKAFVRIGIPVHDSDAVVHELMRAGGAAVAPIEDDFPDVIVAGAVDRARLGDRVYGDVGALRRLEAIVHPLVLGRETAFLKRASGQHQALVVLDIPLLFEVGADRRCDAVAVVSAPAFVQRRRVLRRAGMSAQRFDAILQQQIPDSEKRRRADFVILTGLGKGEMVARVRRIATILRKRSGTAWPGRWK